ncbi:MAG: hypothetical protein ACLGIK_08305 [Gemmatimonadota bacterium]
MYLTLVTLHVLSAMVWIGGVLFLALVGAPALRRVEPPELRARLFEETGTWIMQLRGWLAWGLLSNPDFWRGATGTALGWKLGLVTVMLVLSLWHDVALSPAKARELAHRPDGAAVRRRLVLLARLGGVAAIGVVIAAARLARA